MTGLTELQVRNAKPGRYADGRGLYLLVRPSGSRSWVLRTQVDGKRRDRGLGSTATLSLAQARAKAADLRTRMASGEEIEREAATAIRPVPTFAEAARACHKAIKGGWANKRHDRKSAVWGKSVAVSGTLGGRRITQKKKKKTRHRHNYSK